MIITSVSSINVSKSNKENKDETLAAGPGRVFFTGKLLTMQN